ncbi:MAG: efflux RND transporter periplasmic adaptor subunit [Halomonas sp.]|jgi:membrane fusion protein (multidrug efflux system)|uniref:Efflux RND transporter periplasmic adaptor subunit n=1 Tax=Billgrantia tianxiuensis TaxID=2497861 RepID=A0A6I6SGG0_9GAMM|nr:MULTISPECIES: efflux RND transporter periplasmic adaptor subunit [Halomonas]MCE8032458.1 efflux RND transporter periplasmic adaptor subunit [Halomonas sp. MCCC 1A11057]MDX5433489.1 efflux RND transporter periplasmic adaptor subunit [Halomonas sp.]QHC49579.1 efflux RND transporter periplasmic adaptor subunit [Halomonas tianxiuensis]
MNTSRRFLLAPAWRLAPLAGRICLVASLALATLALATSPPVAAQERTAVIGARADVRPWSDPLEALGTLRADESVTLSATVTEIIAELNFRDGEAVEAGQLLIRLEDSEERAQLRAAQAQRDERRSAVDRLSQLQSRNMAPRADVEDSQARLRQVEAEIQGLEARLTNYRLRAPFDGVVGFRNISVGSLVTPGTELVTLDKLDVMKLDFSVPEVYLAILSPGLKLSARSVAFPEEVFEGEVASIGSRVDPVSRSITVRAEIDNPELRLRPGMLMEVVLQRSPRQAVVVPESALIPSGDRQYVLVIDEADENRLERREVRVGERRTGQAEIIDGLEPNELVVSHGVQRAREGDRVRLLGIASEENSIREILEAHREEGEA